MDTPKKPITTEVDFQKIIDYLKASIAIYDKFLEMLEDNNGWLPLKSDVIEILSKLDPPWRTFYEDKNRLEEDANYEYFSHKEVDAELLNNFLEESTEEFIQYKAELNSLKGELEQANNQKDLSSDEHQNSQPQDLLSLSIAGFFNILALMIHRRSMCQLISDAKDGDDEAFCLAVQIDRTVLQLPYFQQRLLKSQFSDDAKFLDKLASRIHTPILQSKIRYRTLILIFALLENIDVLDILPHEILLNICEKIGVTGGENGIDDVDKLRKRLYEYKKITRM